MPRKTGTTLTRGAGKTAASAGKTKATGKSAGQNAATAPAKEEKPFSFITVRVGKLPGRITSIALNGGRTVSDALSGADLYADGHQIRVNGEKADENTALNEGDTVLLVRKIKGNN